MNSNVKEVSLSVILPAYNDEASIGIVTEQFLDYVYPEVGKLEIIIVDDRSPDNTGLACDELALKYPEVKVIHHKENLGYGATIRDGFNQAKEELVFYTDGDDQYDIKEVIKAINALVIFDADAVIGYRSPRKDGILRFIISRVYNILFLLTFGIYVQDVNCSFKLVKKKVLNRLKLGSKGAFIDAELISQLRKHGHKIKEMPVRHFKNRFRSSTTVKPKLILEMVCEMCRSRFAKT